MVILSIHNKALLSYLGRLDVSQYVTTKAPPRQVDGVITGFNKGTFSLRISDHFTDDMAKFRTEYPEITGYCVDRIQYKTS